MPLHDTYSRPLRNLRLSVTDRCNLRCEYCGSSCTPEAAQRELPVERWIELAREVADAFERRVGQRPHVVICHLHRSKLDANRDRSEGAQGDADRVPAAKDDDCQRDPAKPLDPLGAMEPAAVQSQL